MKVFTQKNSKITFLAIFFYKLVCVDNKFSKPIVVYREGNPAYRFLESILKEYENCKKEMKKQLIEDEIVRDHCHITGKYIGAAHWSCNVNLKLTKKAYEIFHDIKGYESHSIINEIGKFNVKVDVIPNGLEKYLAFTINKNSVFIDSKQFMYYSSKKLVKNLSDDDFKHLTQKFGSNNLKFLR